MRAFGDTWFLRAWVSLVRHVQQPPLPGSSSPIWLLLGIKFSHSCGWIFLNQKIPTTYSLAHGGSISLWIPITLKNVASHTLSPTKTSIAEYFSGLSHFRGERGEQLTSHSFCLRLFEDFLFENPSETKMSQYHAQKEKMKGSKQTKTYNYTHKHTQIYIYMCHHMKSIHRCVYIHM